MDQPDWKDDVFGGGGGREHLLKKMNIEVEVEVERFERKAARLLTTFLALVWELPPPMER